MAVSRQSTAEFQSHPEIGLATTENMEDTELEVETGTIDTLLEDAARSF